MKNTIKPILIALLISSAFNVNAQKLGHVNSQAIVQEMPDYESARQELESYKNDLAKELAKADGYSYIFELTTLLHAGGDDISDKVRKKLGISTSN